MSSLAGNADITGGGAGLIKSIQFVNKSIPTAGNEPITITTIDPTKTVVMIFGNSYISDKVQRGAGTLFKGGTNNHALSPNVDTAISEVIIEGQGLGGSAGDMEGGSPYAHALTTSQSRMLRPAF